jgi:molybdopterin converting factor small subunit
VKVHVRLAETLRPHAEGAKVVELSVGDGATVADVLDALDAVHPAVGRRVRDETGAQRQHVNLFVGPDNVRDLDGLGSLVPAGAEISILPAVSGG